MISKLLFSKVLNLEIEDIHDIDYKTEYEIMYKYCLMYRTINIYELAHKCKDLAVQYNCEISSGYSDYRWFCIIKTDILMIRQFEADTEYGAIFKACEWLLQQNYGAVRVMK